MQLKNFLKDGFKKAAQSFVLSLLASSGNGAFIKAALPPSEAPTYPIAFADSIDEVYEVFKVFELFLEKLELGYRGATQSSVTWLTQSLDSNFSLPQLLQSEPVHCKWRRQNLSKSSLSLQTPHFFNLMHSSLSDGIFELYILDELRGGLDFRPLIEKLGKSKLSGAGIHTIFLHLLGILLLEPSLESSGQDLTRNAAPFIKTDSFLLSTKIFGKELVRTYRRFFKAFNRSNGFSLRIIPNGWDFNFEGICKRGQTPIKLHVITQYDFISKQALYKNFSESPQDCWKIIEAINLELHFEIPAPKAKYLKIKGVLTFNSD